MDIATSKPWNRGGGRNLGEDGALRKGHVNIGPMNNRPVTKQMLLPTSSKPFSSPASDPLPCSFRFELSSRDIGDNYRHTSNIPTIPTAPASLAQQSSTIPNPGTADDDIFDACGGWMHVG